MGKEEDHKELANSLVKEVELASYGELASGVDMAKAICEHILFIKGISDDIKNLYQGALEELKEM